MHDTWESWISERTVQECPDEVDATVAEHLFPDRRSAFLSYAESALSQLAFAHRGPRVPDGGVSARKLADPLRDYAPEVAGPAERGKGLSSPQRRATPLSPPTMLRRRILVVQDDPDGRELFCMLLVDCGHEVQVAGDGLQGIQKALAWRPEVVIADIGLPVLTGYEVAPRLRAALGCQILLIALSGYCQPEDRQRAEQAGFDFYLTKPANLDWLFGVLQLPRDRADWPSSFAAPASRTATPS